MAGSTMVLMLVAALLLTSTMAQSPATSPTRKALSPSPAASPTTATTPSPSTTSVSPADTPAGSTTTTSSISGPPSEAPSPAHNGALSNRITVSGSAAVLIFASALLFSSL